jgi:hypothetical protein
VDRTTVRITAAVAGKATLRIVNVLGEVIYQQNQNLAKGDNVIYIGGLENKARGTYILQAVVTGEQLVQKLSFVK